MSTLLAALQTKDNKTLNGMSTHSSTLNHCVDLFFQIGAMRGQDKQRLINAFVKAYEEDALTAMKLLFWARDVRGGAGERQVFRDIVTYLADKRTSSLQKNLAYIPEFGRWDDLLALVGTKLEEPALALIAAALKSKDGLCAKWMPRPRPNMPTEKRLQGNALRKFMKLTPKEYRAMLVEGSNTVEQLMCGKNWEAIEYSKLPSKAMSDYMKAFSKNDLARFGAYLESVKKGEAKINASAVYPYNIIMNLKHGSVDGADVQWNALPNYMEGNTEIILPVVDVSSSMKKLVNGNPNLSCMDVAISLGLYISERNVGPFKDAFITFDSNPQLQIVKGSLSERYKQMKNAPWGGSTNLEATFRLILDKAKQSNLPQSQMPTMIIIPSDMEFNSAVGGTSSWGSTNHRSWNPTAHEMIKDMYEAAGYLMPKIVFWRMDVKQEGNNPVKFDEKGTALVSGFSPSLLTAILAGKDLSPYLMMMQVVGAERYEKIAA